MYYLALLFFSLSGYTQNLNPPELEALIKKGLEYSYQMDYRSSQECFDKVITIAPENPAGYFFQAALLQFYMLDFATGSKEEEFYYYLNQAIKKSEKILKTEENPWAHFYLGAAHIYRAPYEGWRHRYFAALREGLQSESQLRQTLNLDSTFYDACLGLGSLEYFKARANRYVLGLKLFGDAERGINNIRKAAEHGHYFATTAQHSLAWTLTADGKPEEAKSYTQALLSRYPENRVFLWQLVDICLAEKDWQGAIDTGGVLLDNVRKNQSDCCANITGVKLRIAQGYYGLGEYKTTVGLCEEIIRVKECPDGAIGLKEVIKEARKLLKKAQAKI